MGAELVRVGKYLDDSIEEYSKTFFEELHKKEAGEEYDDEKLQKNRWSMIALQKVNKDLYYPSDYERFHIISNMLARNRDKGYGTEFVFLDDSEMIISPDMLVDFVDGYLVIYNKEYSEENPTLMPIEDTIFNLCNLREVNTLRENK